MSAPTYAAADDYDYPRLADPPDAVGSGGAPGSTLDCIAGTVPLRPRVRGDHYRAVDLVDPVDHHRRQIRKQNPATALPNHSPENTTLSRPALPLNTATSASRKVSQNHLP